MLTCGTRQRNHIVKKERWPDTAKDKKGQNKQNWKRSATIRAMTKSHDNMGEAFKQWRDLRELKDRCGGSLSLLDRRVTLVLVCFTEPTGQYCFVQC